MIMEGIAVYTESQFNPQLGRLNQGYYDILIARKAARNKLPTLSQANYLHPYFPQVQWYLYGGAFIRYLANTYGEDSLQDFFNEYASYYWAGFFYLGDIFPALGIDKAAQDIYGKSLPKLFQEWRSYARQKDQNWVREGKKLVENYHGQIDQLTLSNKKLYYWQSKETNPYLFEYNRSWELIEYNLLTQEQKRLDYSLKPNHASLELIDNHIYYAVNDSERKFSNFDYGGSLI